MTYILGLNAYHGDSSVCLVRDGQVISAVEEERFRRIKHWAGFPSESIRYCLEEAGVSLSEIDDLAVNSDPRASYSKKIKYALFNRPDFRFLIDRFRNKKKRASVRESLEQALPDERFNGRVHHIEHHMCHLASCFSVSPFKCAVAVSVDGFGDFSSAAWGIGEGFDIQVDGRVFFPHSLGIFYQALTQYLGFPHYGDEYKVMGLAPYGEARYLEKMREIVLLKPDGSFELNLKFFRHHQESVTYEWEGGSPSVGCLYADALCDLLGSARKPDEPLIRKHHDVARSIQAMYEEAFFHLLNTLHASYQIDDLTLAGGCAMNSVANGKVYRRSPFKRVYIQSAAGDAGGAIGAAMVVWNRCSRRASMSSPHPGPLSRGVGTDRYVMDHAYLGPSFSPEQIEDILDRKRDELSVQSCKVEQVGEEAVLFRRTASAIADGKVVGWFQGRMEWGPRALGNRSIVCDPRRADMKDVLNLKIKRRESFRPFAPSILREYVSEWFEEDDDVPFMIKVFQIREEKRPEIPAVTHVDGSGRLQTVYKETNPRYFGLIEAFRLITGVPIVLNTSFNENEPVVCTPKEALGCFLRTGMDMLVMGDFMIVRNED